MMIMENIPNPFEELFRQNQSIDKKLTLILKKLNTVDLADNFDVKGIKNAAKILNISVSTLQTRIKEGLIMKENVHFQKNKDGRYSFNKSALLSVKGFI